MSDNNNKNIKRDRFGRYLILDHLVDGGMAKICRARFLGAQADKVVAIKMVQPQYSQDDSFKQMFMDEIKLTFGLIHPNIVQTYDYGIHKDQLFVAMEYCDGRNLKEYLDKLRMRKFVFPVEISVFIVSQICQGLHYAHTFTDTLTGKKSNIIHRDISPHNVMLTYNGAIKIIDFGIAKSETNSEATQAGTIKGKLSYLAPEYLDGHELDARYDEFAVGITLWEMLCSRKLFKANNDLAVLKKIQECNIPAPSSINPNVPPELDEIVLKALSKDRANRYPDLDQLNRVLMRFLYSHYPEFNATDLSYFAKELFKEEIKKDREKLFEYGKIDLAPYLKELDDEKKGISPSQKQGKAVALDEGGRKKNQIYDFGFSNTVTDLEMAQNAAKEITQSVKVNKNDLKEEVKASSEEGTSSESREDKLSKTTTRTRSRITERRDRTRTRTTASHRNKMKKKKSPVKNVVAALVAGLAIFLYLDKGDMSVDPSSEGVESRSPSSDKKLSKKEESKYLKVLLKNFSRHDQKVYVNSKVVEPDFIGMIRLPIGQNLTLRVETPSREHFVKKLYLSEESSKSVVIENTPAVTYGFVVSSRKCGEGKIFIDNVFGENRVENFPITSKIGIPLPIITNNEGREPASKKYTIYYQKKGQSLKREMKVSLEADRRVDLCDYIK